MPAVRSSDRLHNLSGHVEDLAHCAADRVGAMHLPGDATALADEARQIAAELTDQATAHVRESQASAVEYGKQAGDVESTINAPAAFSPVRPPRRISFRSAHDVRDDLSGRQKLAQWASNRQADAQSRAQSWLGHEERHAGIEDHGGDFNGGWMLCRRHRG